jgi:hypothetical protein
MSYNLLRWFVGLSIAGIALPAIAGPLPVTSPVSDMPGTLALMGIGLGALTFCGYRFRK